MDGVVVLAKPVGVTSARAVAQVKRLLGGVRAGHCGTLDPWAWGVLPIALGRATKLAGLIAQGEKRYVARIRLGVETDTDDWTGAVVRAADASHVTLDQLAAAMRSLTGEIEQVPPSYSAVKVNGARAYAAARRGDAVSLKPRTVKVKRFEMLRRSGDVMDCEVDCGAGTYVRALARDLGRLLGCGAHLVSLVRTDAGGFALSDAVTPGALMYAAIRGNARDVIVPLSRVAERWPRIIVTSDSSERVSNGQRLTARDVVAVSGEVEPGVIAVVMDGDRVLAVAEVIASPSGLPADEPIVRYRRVIRGDA